MRFRPLFTFISALGAASFVGAPALAEEPLPPPAATEPVAADLPPPSARTNHIVAGAVTTAVSYGLALGSSFLMDESDFRGAKDLRIPIAGPWMALGKTGCPSGDPECSKATLVIGALLTIIDGVVQAGGLGVIGEGLFLNTSSGRAAPRKAQNADGPTVRAVPFNFEKGGLGLGVVGSF